MSKASLDRCAKPGENGPQSFCLHLPFPRRSLGMKTSARTASFGPYVLDLRSAELRKLGAKVKIGEQAFQILVMLLERPGEMVTRDELRSRLWADNTFVDFDHGLNSAVQRLRDSLSDSAAKPRWIETIPRRGYRFVGQVHWSEDGFPSVLAGSQGVATPSDEHGNGTRPDSQDPFTRAHAPKTHARVAVSFARFAAPVLLVGVLSLALLARHPKHSELSLTPLQIHSLAVLPLDNLSGDPGQDYFSDEVTEELITQLGKIRSVRVISRTSVMQYRGTKKSLSEIARELNVDAVVEGTVSRSGDRVHMTASLVRASPETHLWAESYETQAGYTLPLQGKVALAIAQEIKAQVTAEEQARLASLKGVDPEAQDLYSRGRYVARAQTAQSSQKAIRYFQEAIRKDPAYAAAYAGLAEVYASWAPGEERPRDRMPLAREYAEKALQFDPTLADAHSVLGTVALFYDWNWSAAEQEFQQTIKYSPNHAWAHRWHARWLVSQGRREEAVAEANVALALDPSPDDWDYPIWVFVLAGRSELAAKRAQDLLEMEPNSPWAHFELAQVYELQGKPQQCAQEYLKTDELFGTDPRESAHLRQALAGTGARGYWKTKIEGYRRSARSHYVPPVMVAAACMRSGDQQCALEWLEKGFAERDDLMTNLKVENAFASLRSDARFQDLIRRVGIPQ